MMKEWTGRLTLTETEIEAILEDWLEKHYELPGDKHLTVYLDYSHERSLIEGIAFTAGYN
jgi:plasmid replication initiation protein